MNVTVPLGAGAPEGVPDALPTVASSCTTVPGVIVVLPVTSVDPASTFVVIVSSNHVLVTSVPSPLLSVPLASVLRVRLSPATVNVVVAWIVSVPAPPVSL